MQDIPANIEKAAATASDRLKTARENIGSVVYGQDKVVELAIAAILSGGHALLVGVPGLAKTLLVDTLGTVLGLDDKRVQFTPDLMPGDILGSEVLEETTKGKREFRFIPGPVFTQLLMADEINRASPRTQSALLQAMQERFVTIAGVRHDFARPAQSEIDSIREQVSWGPGPRAGQALMLATRARALIDGRLSPSIDDVLALAGPVLSHRMALNFSARADGQTVDSVIETLKDRIR